MDENGSNSRVDRTAVVCHNDLLFATQPIFLVVSVVFQVTAAAGDSSRWETSIDLLLNSAFATLQHSLELLRQFPQRQFLHFHLLFREIGPPSIIYRKKSVI